MKFIIQKKTLSLLLFSLSFFLYSCVGLENLVSTLSRAANNSSLLDRNYEEFEPEPRYDDRYDEDYDEDPDYDEDKSEDKDYGRDKNRLIETGLLLSSGISSYQYGTHTLNQSISQSTTNTKRTNLTYALKSDTINLSRYNGKVVTIIGSKVKGYPIDGGPEFIHVDEIEIVRQEEDNQEESRDYGRGKNRLIETGLLLRSGITSYQYGTHTLNQRTINTKRINLTYALKSDRINLNRYSGKIVTIIGSKVRGYPVDFGPEFIHVDEIKLVGRSPLNSR